MGSVQAFKENCVTMSIEGDAPSFKKGKIIQLPEESKRLQEALGFSGKDADGIFGRKSSGAMFDKYGDVTDPKVRENLPESIRADVETMIGKIGPGMFKQHPPRVQIESCLPTGSIGQNPVTEQNTAPGKTHRLRTDDDVVQKGKLETAFGLTDKYNSKAPAMAPAAPEPEFNVMTPMGDFTGFTAPANRM